MAKLIVGMSELAKHMSITRIRLRELVDEKRIRPDYMSGANYCFFTVKHAVELIKSHVRQKGLPKRVRRTYDK